MGLRLTLVLFARSLQEQVIAAPYMIFCSRRQGRSLAVYTGSTTIHHFVLSAAAVACLAVAAGGLTLVSDPDGMSAALAVLAVVAPWILLRDYLRALAFAHLHLATAVIMDTIVAFLQLGGLGLMIVTGTFSLPAVFGLVGGASAAACAGWFLARQQPLRFLSSRYVEDWRRNWSFAKWALASQLVGSAAPYLLPWLLAAAHGRAATGVLAASATLVGVAQMFVTGVGNFLTPKAARAFAQGGVAALRRVLAAVAGVFAVALGGFCVLVAMVEDLLPVFVYGNEYADLGPVIVVLSVAMLIASLGMVAGNGLWAMERPSAALGADVSRSRPCWSLRPAWCRRWARWARPWPPWPERWPGPACGRSSCFES